MNGKKETLWLIVHSNTCNWKLQITGRKQSKVPMRNEQFKKLRTVIKFQWMIVLFTLSHIHNDEIYLVISVVVIMKCHLLRMFSRRKKEELRHTNKNTKSDIIFGLVVIMRNAITTSSGFSRSDGWSSIIFHCSNKKFNKTIVYRMNNRLW